VGGKGVSLHGCCPEADVVVVVVVVVVLDVQLEPTLSHTNPSPDLVPYNHHPHPTLAPVVHINPHPFAVCYMYNTPPSRTSSATVQLLQ
jgi:hypothetical protein